MEPLYGGFDLPSVFENLFPRNFSHNNSVVFRQLFIIFTFFGAPYAFSSRFSAKIARQRSFGACGETGLDAQHELYIPALAHASKRPRFLHLPLGLLFDGRNSGGDSFWRLAPLRHPRRSFVGTTAFATSRVYFSRRLRKNSRFIHPLFFSFTTNTFHTLLAFVILLYGSCLLIHICIFRRWWSFLPFRFFGVAIFSFSLVSF